MSNRVLHLLEDLLTCVVVLLIAAYVCMEWAAAAPEPTKAERVDVLCTDHPACYAVTGWYEVWMYET